MLKALLFLIPFTLFAHVHEEVFTKVRPNPENVEKFLADYPSSYQDILVNNEVIKIGTNICEERFELLRPIFDRYQKPFSMLDIGACEGYFSFRAATEYGANCTMFENGYHTQKPLKLLDLCNLNTELEGISLLNYELNLQSLKEFSRREHFDAVLALLVIHQMAEQDKQNFLRDAKEYINIILSLGTDVIIETSTELYPILDEYMQDLCTKMGGTYLGEQKRLKNTPDKTRIKGRFYWFHASNDQKMKCENGISQETYEKFNGVYRK